MSDNIIASFEYNNDEIRFQTSEYKGKKYFSVRLWYQDKDAEEWRPTQKGVNLRTEAIGDFLDAVMQLVEEVKPELLENLHRYEVTKRET